MHWNNTLRGFIGGFSSRCEAARARARPSLFTRSIARSLEDRFYRIASRNGGETIIVTHRRCNSSALTPISLSSSPSPLPPFSFFFLPFSFSVCEESAAVHLSRRSAPASSNVVHALAPTLSPSPVLSPSTPPTPPLSRGMMDLHGERRGTENNKAGHAIQARMQRNYTPISLSLAQSYAAMKYLFRYNVILIREYFAVFSIYGEGERARGDCQDIDLQIAPAENRTSSEDFATRRRDFRRARDVSPRRFFETDTRRDSPSSRASSPASEPIFIGDGICARTFIWL